MNIFQHTPNRKKGDLRIIGAISIDLNGISDEPATREADEEARIHKVLQTVLKEFCSNSTVHGVRYLAERKRHWTERIWWTVAVSLSVILCVSAIISIWNKWHQRPVITSFNDKSTSVGMIPFPAVTICSTRKFTKEKLDLEKYIEAIGDMNINQTMISNLPPELLNRLDAVLQICFKEVTDLMKGVFIPRTESIYKTIEDVGPDHSETIIFTTWIGQFTQLKPIFTGEGLCYTFNALNSKEIYSDEVAPELITVADNKNATYWNIETGYETNVDESDVYPYRVFGSGLRDSFLTVVGILLDDSHQYCSALVEGFHISLHSPSELPKMPDEFIHIPVEQDIFISVKPNMVTTSRGLRRYSPKGRGCFFQSERQLRFFRAYTQRHCELECSANFTKLACGCVKFASPRDNDTQVCTIANFRCYVMAEHMFSKNQLIKFCNCLPDCTYITYDVEISQAQSRYADDVVELKNSINETGMQATSKLFIWFKEHHFISLNRSEAYTVTDFIASCGGILGLFMGVSLLSVIELIYFFTLRLCCKLRDRKPIDASALMWAKRRNLTVIKKRPLKRF